MKHVAQALANFRKKHKLSQKDLGQRLLPNCKGQYISNIERLQTPMPEYYAPQLIKMGMHTDELLQAYMADFFDHMDALLQYRRINRTTHNKVN